MGGGKSGAKLPKESKEVFKKMMPVLERWFTPDKIDEILGQIQDIYDEVYSGFSELPAEIQEVIAPEINQLNALTNRMTDYTTWAQKAGPLLKLGGKPVGRIFPAKRAKGILSGLETAQGAIKQRTSTRLLPYRAQQQALERQIELADLLFKWYPGMMAQLTGASLGGAVPYQGWLSQFMGGLGQGLGTLGGAWAAKML